MSAHLGGVPCLAPLPNADGQQMKLPDYPVLARGHVRHVGDAVAMVVADTEEQAREALEALPVTYEDLAGDRRSRSRARRRRAAGLAGLRHQRRL